MTFFEFFSHDNETDIPTETSYDFHRVKNTWKNGVVFRYANATDLNPIDSFEV